MTNNVVADASNTDPDTDAATIRIDGVDLSILKTDHSATFVPGMPITYDLEVTNDGPSAAVGAEVTDLVPSTITNVTWTCEPMTGGRCSANEGSGNIVQTAVDLAPGESIRIAVTGMVSADTTVAPLVNSAEVTPAPGEPPDVDPSNNLATDEDSLEPHDDLFVHKDGPDSATAGGDNVVYTLTVGNGGPSLAHDVVVTDPTPAGLTFLGLIGCPSGSEFPCELGDLPAGDAGNRTFSAVYAIPQRYLADGHPDRITNTATATSTTSEVSDTALTPVLAEAELHVTKSGSTRTLPGDTDLVFTVAITNDGPSAAQNVAVADPTPIGLTWTSNSGGCESGWPCSVPVLDAGATLTIESHYSVAPGYLAAGHPATIINQATATSSTDPLPPPPAEWQLPVEPAPGELSLSKLLVGLDAEGHPVPFVGTAASGQEVTWELDVANEGATTIYGDLIVHDALPSGLRFVSAVGRDWECGVSGTAPEVIDCVSDQVLDPGESSRLLVTTRIAEDASGPIENLAIVSAPWVAADTPTNNTSGDVVSIDMPPVESTTTTGPATSTTTSPVPTHRPTTTTTTTQPTTTARPTSIRPTTTTRAPTSPATTAPSTTSTTVAPPPPTTATAPTTTTPPPRKLSHTGAQVLGALAVGVLVSGAGTFALGWASRRRRGTSR
jgi:uncharacterized repeat protein (TIGR01451 family)